MAHERPNGRPVNFFQADGSIFITGMTRFLEERGKLVQVGQITCNSMPRSFFFRDQVLREFLDMIPQNLPQIKGIFSLRPQEHFGHQGIPLR